MADGEQHNIARIGRMTTQYREDEDRIRVLAELTDDQPCDPQVVSIWLSQRLLRRLVPVMTGWLQDAERDVRNAGIQDFAQQQASAEKANEPPVTAPPGDSWLVHEVDITRGEQAVALTFKSAGDDAAKLVLTEVQLRQWLGIVYAQCRQADWPLTPWPRWITPEAQSVGQSVVH